MHGDHMRKLRCFIISILLLPMSINCYCSHIIGGDITYTFLSFNQDKTEATYEVNLSLFRDPTGVPFDDYAGFGVFRQRANGSWESYTVVPRVLIDEIYEYNPLGDACKTRFLTEEGLEYTNYTFELSLELNDNDYMIAYQKCCRNYTINNVIGDGDLGAVYDVIITPESMRLGNSSPKFGPIPPLFVCSGYDLNIDHSATDIDGDRLEYRFCTPLYPGIDDGSFTDPNCCGCTNPNPAICTPPYPALEYESGFTPQNPMGGNPQVTIDNISGMITGKPEFLGPYVVVVCVDEYRDGRLIGTIRRDFELNSIVCTEYLKAEVASDTYYTDQQTNKTIAYYESCNDTRFTIENLSRDEQFIQDYIWEIYNENNDLVYTRSGLSSRDISFDLPGSGKYSGLMILNDGISCFDTAFMELVVAPDVKLDFTYSLDNCLASPIKFNNQSTQDEGVQSWYWDFGDGNTSDQRDPSHTYANERSYQVQLTATDIMGCDVSYTDQVDYELIEVSTISIAKEICQGESYMFANKEIKDAGSYDLILKDKNGCDSIVTLQLEVLQNTLNEIVDTICLGDEYLFAEELIIKSGEYRDTLTNGFGCDSITVLNLHVAENLTRLELTSPLEVAYGSTITLIPSVEGGELIYKQWSNDDRVLSNTLELNYLVEKDEWLFFESMNELYCFAQDSALVRSNIIKGVFVPNVFSPNNDGDNDTFLVGTTKSIKLVSTKIFDRWGNFIFGSEDTFKSLSANSWDGSFNGDFADIGVYVYFLEFEYVNGDRVSKEGTVQLVR